MNRKIVAIGGGENGRVKRNGEKLPYETEAIDKEIIRLSGSEKPHFLLLAHAQIHNGDRGEQKYFETMKKIYGDMYGCEVRWLKISELQENFDKAKCDIEWADIIYEGGGNTVGMIELWRGTGFDKLLRKAWDSGKVMCGLSAGAICWFTCGNSDCIDKEVNKIDGLGFIDAYLSPHCQENGKRKSELSSLRHIDKIGLSLSNCCAVEIVDDKYRILKSEPFDKDFKPYAQKTYWDNDELFEENLAESTDFRSINELLSKSLTNKEVLA